MALRLNVPYTDTPVSGSPTLNLGLMPVNFPVDFSVMEDVAGEVIVTNSTCAVDRPERFRFAASDVKDVYKGTDIDPNLYTPSRRGVSVVIQLTDVYSLTDDTNTSYQAALPVSGHLVLKMPNNALLTGDMVKTFLSRLVDGAFTTGLVDTARLQSLLRGSLRPKGL